MPPNFRAVFFSFFINGVPVMAMKQAFGSVFSILMPISPYWLRCPSSISTKMLGSVNGVRMPRTAVSNLLIIVVMTASLLLLSSSTSLLPVVAFSTRIWHLRNVPVICRSRSVRSVTRMIFGLRISLSRMMACASITIVSDLPLPCVCQMTPPRRRPPSMWRMRCIVCRTAKYCW